MRILHILTQKPFATGSGTYFTESIKALHKLGHKQAAVVGVEAEENFNCLPDVAYYSVRFSTEELPFHVVGMSNSMPYPSTRYNQLTPLMASQMEKAFIEKIESVLTDFAHDLIVCHHLYLLTALVREHFPQYKIVGISHGSDLRQLQTTELQKERIVSNIRKLDVIFALHRQQQLLISELFALPLERIKILGTGYSAAVFYNKNYVKKTEPQKIIFAGKISYKKGLASLLRALQEMKHDRKFELYLAGSYSSEQEYKGIVELARSMDYPVTFCGALTQGELAEAFNRCQLMVLPSFYEGLPLVIMEALACGLKVVTTDLPGVQDWLKMNIPNNKIIFVKPPRVVQVDEPLVEDLPAFEKALGEAISRVLVDDITYQENLSQVTWDSVAKRLLQQ